MVDDKDRILIVDDDEGTRKTLALILHKKGYETETAATGQEALEKARERNFNLALLDIRLPDMEGGDLIAPLREMQPDLAVIMVTGHASVGTAVQALNAGASGYVTKPVNVDELLAMAREALEKQRLGGEKRRAEEALQRTEMEYRTLAENSPDLIARFDRHLRHTYVNPAAALAGRLSASEYIGKTIPESGVPEQVAEVWEERIRQVLKTGQMVDVVDTFPTPDGIKYFHTRLVPELAPDGSVRSVLSVARDITDRKQAEEALQESEERYRNVVERANDGMAILQDRIVKYVNPRLAEEVGYATEELIGTPFDDYIHPNDLHQVVDRYQRRMAGEDVMPVYEIAVRRKDGSKVHVEINAGIITYQGKPAELVIVRDLTERRRTEESLKLFRALLDQSSDAIEVVNPETGCYLDANEKAWQDLGYSREELLSLRVSDVDPIIDRASYTRISEELLKSGFATIESHHRRKDGSLFPVEVNMKHVQLDRGYVVSVARDITERKRAEEALEQRVSQLALLNEIGGQVAALLDLDQVLDRAAQLVQERFGFHFVSLFTRVPGEDRLAMRAKAGPCAHLFAQDYTVSLDEGMVGWVGQHGETLLANDVAAEPRYVNPCPDDLLTRSELAVPIRIGGEVVGVLDLQSSQADAFTPGDVTTQETLAGQIAVAIHNAHLYAQAERRNRELNLLNRVIAATAVTAETGIQPTLEVVCRELALAFDAPQSAAALFNEEKTEAVVVAEYPSASSGQRLTPDRPSALGATIPVTGNPWVEHLLTHKVPLAVGEAQTDPRLAAVHDLMGRWDTVSLLLVPLLVEGQVVGSLGVAAIEPRAFSSDEMDLAQRVAEQVSGVLARARLREERRQLEEQFRQAQKLEAVGRLAGGIAHDFNNLLTVIHLSSRLLERKLLPQDPLRQHVDRIRDAAQRAAGLTGQLLAFSRREIVEPRLLDLNQALGSLDDMLRRILGEDVELRTIPAEALWPVKIDPSQLDQVIVNLAVNARDAMPTGGKLTIETANVVLDEAYTARHLDVAPGEYVLLAVSDTGVGMSEEVKAHLFEPFFTTKEKGKGTGLGLATVFGIVKQNQGHIWVYSELGRGTTFKVYLPRAATNAQPSAEPPPAGAAPAARAAETVLLVEDEDRVRELIGDVLAAQGYRVLAANDGVEALQVAERHVGPIHLLLSDVVMPRMGGQALAEELRASHPEMRVLYTSGYTDNAIVHHGVLDEGTHFLSKPFELDTLVRKVHDVLHAGT
jgi:PAS domain S-box-containing protein